MPDFRTEDRVTLLHDMPTHHAGEHGTVHGTYGEYVGVRFDTSPHLIRYTACGNLQPATHDAADVTQAAADAVIHIIEEAWDVDTPCSKTDCDTPAVWWAEHTHCGDIHYRCEPHRAADDERHTNYINQTGHTNARCIRCGNLATIPVQWRAL